MPDQERCSAEELKSQTADKVIDARGLIYPAPIMEASRAIQQIHAGELLEIISNDATTKQDLPAWADASGHSYLGALPDQDKAVGCRMFIRKKM
jgi:tRNA 2-thiouridine synthesizing protein A